MWHTERMVGAGWVRIAPWGNVDNAKDSAQFLADSTGYRTRVVDSLSLLPVWDSVEGDTSQDTPEEETPTHPNAAYYASLGITQDSPEVTGAWGDDQEEGTPEGTADNPAAVFEEVTEGRAPGFGLFVFQTLGGAWHVSADLPNVRTYLSAPYRTEEQARAEVRRIAPMYPRLKWYRVIA
jgi:hypothetical protein